MYTGLGFREFEIGDVDVIKHEGTFHLFHLVLPNHDYIAHAVSDDGLNWRRVKNALFIDDPGHWDDDMLWTMHVSPSPYEEGVWRMFYTGLSMGERGRIQRVGMAHSRDLYSWEKVEAEAYPLAAQGEFYESSLDEGRHWVSFRDPYYFQDEEHRCLLVAARVNEGPIIRRGCVALLNEASENNFEFKPPLFHPGRYDDVEVPNAIKIDGRYYLIGSIREGVKVHYWYTDDFYGPYYNFADNVLMPQGNYAARVCWNEDHFVVWNFFFEGMNPSGRHLLAPPKELAVTEHGELKLRSFRGFDDLVLECVGPRELMPMQQLLDNPNANGDNDDVSCWFGCKSGFEVFMLKGEYSGFRLSGTLHLEGRGKCGLVLHLDEEGNGYYISLDLQKGIAQIRSWSCRPDGNFEEAFEYEQIQAANYVAREGAHPFCLISYEQYVELSLFGEVMLTLADSRFSCGRTGFYAESANIRIDELKLETLEEIEHDQYYINPSS